MKIQELEEKKYNFKTGSKPVLKLKGLSKENIEKISRAKNEPDWMKNLRLDAFEVFKSKPLPKWSIIDLKKINFDNFDYYLKPEDQPSIKWSEVPKEIKKTFEKLGIPQAERSVLGGVVAQYESESVYNSLRKELSEKGVIFVD
ncbi:MAG: Fe-S cluster assembly protein SufB, partial [Candidatus Marsarchaeota archaeon]|nr:Fe-S cluster assembly protein SufB [Candidatus Marsarchaeota archaeon]